ncbi:MULTISPECIES: replicative DNA helicase [Niastella]|uniref:Replicative DNA helicase n=1 Tax=Niastella soli TaxID=2821487 RepID=A0ABS3Z293_9BACT|nr:replicative DNA helicase [Niastella soli]MBO9203800.1 replicative DNA helicase [Niastella soli]
MEKAKNDRDKKNRDTWQVDVSNMVYGKLPPNAKDLEELVLGVIMLEPGSIDRVLEYISADSFYSPAHQEIFRSMFTLHQKSQPTDIGMVVEELKAQKKLEEVGGPYYVTMLTNKVTSSASIEFYAKVIAQKYLAREMIRVGSEIVQNAYENFNDAFQLLDLAEQQLMNIGSKHVHGDVKGMDTVMVNTINRIEEWRKQDSPITGVPSGYEQLDRATRGWQPSDLIILAARPSVGKTSFALRLARNAALNGIKPVPVAIWSLEMEDVQLGLRMLAAESGMMLHRLQTGCLGDEDMARLYRTGIHTLAGTKIFVDDQPGLNLLKLRAKARRLKKRYDIGLILVDYLQLMSDDDNRGNREQEISRISRGLKLLAKELGIPVIALSQLSRDVEKRTGVKKQPQLSDLRESGSIEQDADVVIFLWGPEDEEIEKDASLRDRRYARIAKARNGMLLTINFELNKDTQEWEETEQDPFSKPLPLAAPAQPVRPLKTGWKESPRLPYADDTKDEELPF